MTEDTPTEATSTAQADDSAASGATTPEAETTSAEGDLGDGDMFPRSYVEQLRAENQRYRERGKRADDLASRLHTASVAATGRLADPDDLPFDEAHLDDPDKLTAAIDELLARKPHMAARRPTGDIGQGPTPSTQTVDLAGILRARAG